MKAKDLAELLLNNPDLNVIIRHSKFGADKVNNLKFTRIITVDGRNIEFDDLNIEKMRKSIASFSEDKVVESWKSSGFKTPYEDFIKEQIAYHESEKQLLASIEAAPYCLIID